MSEGFIGGRGTRVFWCNKCKRFHSFKSWIGHTHYGLYEQNEETLSALKRLTRGTGIEVKQIKGTDNILISGKGFGSVYRQLGGNVGLSATTIIKARKRVLKKRKKSIIERLDKELRF